ncbi:hypothetical protein [Nocardia sp. NPDC057030]|uniref:hypothetical protein n=1 Tax=unclassified Nocardia TaxID=2637762 RepID=UPI003624D67A
MNTIDDLTAGEHVKLMFSADPATGNRPYSEAAIFQSIDGAGEDRRATFESIGADGRPYRWDAYRFEGNWAYGTGADRLGLL